MELIYFGSLTDRNMVTIRIYKLEITNIYTEMTKSTKPFFSTIMRVVSTREGTLRKVAGEFNTYNPSWQRWVALFLETFFKD